MRRKTEQERGGNERKMWGVMFGMKHKTLVLNRAQNCNKGGFFGRDCSNKSFKISETCRV